MRFLSVDFFFCFALRSLRPHHTAAAVVLYDIIISNVFIFYRFSEKKNKKINDSVKYTRKEIELFGRTGKKKKKIYEK